MHGPHSRYHSCTASNPTPQGALIAALRCQSATRLLIQRTQSLMPTMSEMYPSPLLKSAVLQHRDQSHTARANYGRMDVLPLSVGCEHLLFQQRQRVAMGAARRPRNRRLRSTEPDVLRLRDLAGGSARRRLRRPASRIGLPALALELLPLLARVGSRRLLCDAGLIVSSTVDWLPLEAMRGGSIARS